MRPVGALSTLLVALMGGGLLAWGLTPPSPLDGPSRGLGSLRPSKALTHCSKEPRGLSHAQIAQAMRDFVPGVLPCVSASAESPQATLQLELNVACTGGIDQVEIVAAGDWPDPVVACVVQRLDHAAFPAHGLVDGHVVGFPIRFRPDTARPEGGAVEQVSSDLRLEP
ncbi:MAG: hypothetical protein KTR31_20275 [Myxococcales bacterium]|nr:hypothetical protein [Myxococcales bacterium]